MLYMLLSRVPQVKSDLWSYCLVMITVLHVYVCACSVDDVLGGGVCSGEVVEVWGPAASGKTQVHTVVCII